MERDIDYENSNICVDSRYNEYGIKCKNYIICETVLPEWWFDCKGCYLCTNCDVMFGNWRGGKGILEMTNKLECPICLEMKESISQPRCNHSLCVGCFKRCYYGDETRDGEPTFPYPDIEDEYYRDEKNVKWMNDYPLIKIFNEEWNKWDDKRIEKYYSEYHLRICPICRK
jgi:hypothetical protein